MDVVYRRFGQIEVDGETFDHDVVIESGRVRRRKKGPSKPYRDDFDHTPLSARENIPWSAPTIVIGLGADGRLPVMQEVREIARTRGVELVEMPTGEACELLRSLPRDSGVSAILHVTC